MHALRNLKVTVKSKAQVQKAVKNLSPKQMESLFSNVASYFSVLSEPSRLRIMYAVCTGEKTVSEVIELCGSSQANVSRHLVALHKAGILNRRKQGVAVYYSIADNETVEMCQMVCSRLAQSLH
ncbi:MAG: hypothetical protein RL551_449 [Pseudomonadota bacterium]|jgi:DNA-binding transcriptional ArsR family regulator